MPKLGSQSTDRKTDNGRLYWGDKDTQYLKKNSREAVEEHHNSPILFFELDYDQSLKNFYGELLVKKLKNPKGIQIRGTYKIEQQDMTKNNGIPNQLMKLTVSLYWEQLNELGIKPKRGDYFGVGQRLYYIEVMPMLDSGPGNVMLNRERLRVDYISFQEDDEAIQKDVWGDNLGLEYQINNQNGEILKK